MRLLKTIDHISCRATSAVSHLRDRQSDCHSLGRRWTEKIFARHFLRYATQLTLVFSTLLLHLLVTSCTHQDGSRPGWIPPAGNSTSTFLYSRPSSIHCKEPTIELLWNSGFIPSQRGYPNVDRTQYLSTGMNFGKMVLGVFRGGIFFFQEDGELTFHHVASGLTAGFLFDVEGKGSTSAFVKAESDIAVYDIHGTLLNQTPIQSIIYDLRVGRLDGSSDFVLITSEDERIPIPAGAQATEWAKRTVRCYNAQSLEEKWEYRTGPTTRIAAIEDVNDDGYNEVICGTYASENGVSWQDTYDTGHGYVFALDRFGRRLWMQTFAARYASIWPSVADLDGDGKPEVVVACGSWLRNWGGVCVLNAKDGSMVCRFPADGELDYSITAAGVADLNGDGRQEIICSSTGHHGGFFVLDSQCKPTGYEHKISPKSMDYDFVVCRLGAINDIDGDGKLEVIGTTSIEKIIAKDPRFAYSKFSDPTLLVLSSTLLLKTNLALDEPCSEMAVSDLIAGGANEIITLTDNISVYSVKEGKR